MKSDPRERRNHYDRRKVERREPKRGVNVRHDDKDGYVPRRIRRAVTIDVSVPPFQSDDTVIMDGRIIKVNG